MRYRQFRIAKWLTVRDFLDGLTVPAEPHTCAIDLTCGANYAGGRQFWLSNID